MSVAIIDYGSGNLRSVARAFGKAGAEVHVTADPGALAQASHIVLPGVGAFGDCMRGLSAISGMRESLEEAVLHRKKPFLGVCVGMQLLFEEGHEHGVHAGLGWLPGAIMPLAPRPAPLKIPHMGWNALEFSASQPLFAGISPGDHAYFVHSYHALAGHVQDVVATVDYGGPVVAAVARGNIFGTQFHPEKSQETGLKLIANFLTF